MRRNWPLVLVSFGLLCCVSLALARLWLLPRLQLRIERQLATWMEKEHLIFRYEGLHFHWYGLRLDKVAVEGHGIEAKGAVEVHLRLWPDFGFARPEHIVFDRWRIRWTRGQALAETSPSKASDLPPVDGPVRAFARVQTLLQRFRETSVLVELRQLAILVQDASGHPLITMPEIDLSYATAEQALQVDIRTLLYRQQSILKGIEGQIILNAEQDKFPFLLTARDTGDIPWQLQGSFSRDFNAFELRHKRSGIPPSWQPYFRLIKPLDSLQVLVKLSVEGLTRADSLHFDMQLASSNLHLTHPLLGEIPWGPFPFSLRAKGDLEPETGSLVLRSGMMHLAASRKHPPVRVYFQGQKADLLAPMRSEPLRLSLSMPDTPCQILLDALPENAFPLLNGFALQGSMSGQARLQLLKRDESPLQMGNHAFTCQLLKVPPSFTAAGIKARRPEAFAPLNQISETYLNSLIAAEDGGFWRHDGFRLNALVAAFQANLRAGRVLYGGSTLTMQLVKNLYLSREKVLSRKVQELYLAWVLEQVLRKEDILEIYANIVEFGPNLRGIGAASRGYFGKEPRELNMAEAVFLASIMPSPNRFFVENYCEGRLSDSLLDRMQKTALGASVLSKHTGWMSEYAQDLRGFQFRETSLESRCSQQLRVSLGKGPKAEKNRQKEF